MNRKRPNALLIAMLLVLSGPVMLSAEEDFLPVFERTLFRLGYQERETAMIMTAAREWNWQAVDPEFAELAVLSLTVCDRAQTKTQAHEQTELMYHLAAMHQEMKALGFTQREIARIALNTSRDVAEKLRLRENADNSSGRGEMIRDRIREELCDAGLEAQELKIMDRIRNRMQQSGPMERGRGASR